MRGDFVVLHRSLAFQHLAIVGAERVGNLAGKEIMIGAPDDLIGGQVEQLLEPAIRQHEPAVCPLHVNDSGGMIDHIFQEAFAAAERLFHLFAVGDALQGTGHADGVAVLIPDGPSARAEPAVLAVFRQQPVLRIVRLVPFHVRGQCGQHPLAIAGVQPGCPALQDVRKLLPAVS